MNLIKLIDCWRADDKFFWNNFYFIVVKETWYGKKYGRFLENLFEYYFSKNNIIVNVDFFSDLKLEYYCEYDDEILLQVSLKQETKIDRREYEIFSEKITGPWNI